MPLIADDVADIARRMREIKGEPEPPIVADGKPGSDPVTALPYCDGWTTADGSTYSA